MTDDPTVEHNGPPDDSIFSANDKTSALDVPNTLGPYTLSVLLGRGGMGEVWKALDSNLERDVAIKLMRKELLANEEAVKRFSREARAVARLNHPNIVQVYSFGDDQGVMYMVMEMVEGETVTDRLKQMGTIPVDMCVDIMLQTIEGLSYANARGIIHRDIKPSNLMLTTDFRVKIADFGLAKMIEHDTQMTAAGTTMGSPNYMSPEQARGEEADHRSDIYALGISFYQMLTGKLPFTAQTPLAVLLKHIQEPLPKHEVICKMCDGNVQAVLTKMTEKNPDDRYQTYGGLAAAMAALAPKVPHRGGHAVTSSIASAPSPPASKPPHQVDTTAGNTVSSTPAPAVSQTPVAVPVQENSLNPYGVETPSNLTIPVKPTKQLWLVFTVVLITMLGLIGGYVAWINPRDTDQPVDPDPPPLPPAITPTIVATEIPVVQSPVASPAISEVTPTPVKTPPPVAVRTPLTAGPSTLFLGAANTVPGTLITVYDQSGTAATQLPAGTAMTYNEARTVNGTPFYAGGLNGQTYLVRPEDGYITTGRPAATVSTPTITYLILGTSSGTDEKVPIYRDERARTELRKIDAGTSVILIQSLGTMSKVALPDGQQVFVYTGMTQKPTR